MSDHYGYAAAKEANERLNRQRDAYRYSTEPLRIINDTLQDILNELRKINDKIHND